MYRDLEARCRIRSVLSLPTHEGYFQPQTPRRHILAADGRCIPRKFFDATTERRTGCAVALWPCGGLSNEEVFSPRWPCDYDCVPGGALACAPWLYGTLGLYIRTSICCSNSHQHLASTAQRRRQKQIPRPHHHPFLRKHPSSHRRCLQSQTPLQANANLHRKPATWHQHDDLSQGPFLSKRGPQPLHNWYQLAKVFTHLTSSPPHHLTISPPHHVHARSRYRQTDTQHPFHSRCRVIPNLRSHSRTCHQPNSPRGESRGRNRGHRIGLLPPHCDLLNQQAQFNSNNQTYRAAPLSAHDGGASPCSNGRPFFSVSKTSTNDASHDNRSSPLKLMPFPPLDVSANSTLIESLAPSGDAASQSGVWGLPARALSNSWARGRLRRAAIDGLMIKLRLARDCFDCSIPLSWQLVRQSIASNYPLLQIQASKPRTRISYHYCWVESKGCEVSVGMTRRCAGTVSDQAPPYSFLSPL